MTDENGQQIDENIVDMALKIEANIYGEMEEYCKDFRKETTADIKRTTVEDFFENASHKHMEKLIEMTDDERALIKRILNALNISRGTVAGDHPRRVRSELFFTEADQIEEDDAVLPHDIIDTIVGEIQGDVEKLIKRKHQVKNIDWSKSGIKVTCKTDDGIGEFRANHLICTLPVGVMQKNADVMFNPSLPSDFMKHLQSINAGKISKYIFDWEKPWKKDTSDLVFLQEDSSLKSWTNGLINLQHIEDRKGEKGSLVIGWVVGDHAEMADKLPDEKIKTDFIQHLRKFLKDDTVPTPSALHRQCWSVDPFTLGSYSAPGLNSHPDAVEFLSKPIPNMSNPKLIFAGEAYEPKMWSYAHGAFLSGQRAAKNYYQKSHKLKINE